MDVTIPQTSGHYASYENLFFSWILYIRNIRYCGVICICITVRMCIMYAVCTCMPRPFDDSFCFDIKRPFFGGLKNPQDRRQTGSESTLYLMISFFLTFYKFSGYETVW